MLRYCHMHGEQAIATAELSKPRCTTAQTKRSLMLLPMEKRINAGVSEEGRHGAASAAFLASVTQRRTLRRDRGSVLLSGLIHCQYYNRKTAQQRTASIVPDGHAVLLAALASTRFPTHYTVHLHDFTNSHSARRRARSSLRPRCRLHPTCAPPPPLRRTHIRTAMATAMVHHAVPEAVQLESIAHRTITLVLMAQRAWPPTRATICPSTTVFKHRAFSLRCNSFQMLSRRCPKRS